MSETPSTTPSAPQEAPPARKPRRWLPWAAGVGAFILGLVVASAGGGGESSPAASTPTVTTTLPAPPAVTVTKPVPTVPAVCKEALDAADKVIATAGEGFNITAQAMEAAASFDPEGITAATEKLNTLNEKKLTPQLKAYAAARDKCNG